MPELLDGDDIIAFSFCFDAPSIYFLGTPLPPASSSLLLIPIAPPLLPQMPPPFPTRRRNLFMSPPIAAAFSTIFADAAACTRSLLLIILYDDSLRLFCDALLFFYTFLERWLRTLLIFFFFANISYAYYRLYHAPYRPAIMPDFEKAARQQVVYTVIARRAGEMHAEYARY